jgi:hypothetical protein
VKTRKHEKYQSGFEKMTMEGNRTSKTGRGIAAKAEGVGEKRLRFPYSPDQLGGGNAWDKGNGKNGASRLFHDLAPHDTVQGPVTPFDQDVRYDALDQPERGVVVEQSDVIDTGEGCQNLCSIAFRLDGPFVSLQAPDGPVTVHADNQHVSQIFRMLEITNMSLVKDIEASVGKDAFLLQLLVLPDFQGKRFPGEYF